MRKVPLNATRKLLDKFLDQSFSQFLAWIIPLFASIFGAIQAESIYRFLSTQQVSAGSTGLIAFAFLLAGYLAGRLIHKPKTKPEKKKTFQFHRIGKYEVKMLFDDGQYTGLVNDVYCAEHEKRLISLPTPS